MTRKNLFTKLNQLCLELDNEFMINSGGCCYVAACIIEQLELKKIPYTVICYGSGDHYAVRVSDRIINRDDCNYHEISYDNYISSKELFFTYYNEDWNLCYDKSNNSSVKTQIKSLFEKYENRRT